MIWKLKTLIETASQTQTEINGKWIPSRPLEPGFIQERIKGAWFVLTGKADAVIWPGGQ